MSRPRAAFPAYRLHRPSGQAVVTLAGEDRYLGPHGSPQSRNQYDRAILEWVAAGRPQQPLKARNLSVAELCLAFWQHAQQRYRVDGQPSGEIPPYKSVIRLLRQLYGTTAAYEFGSDQLRAIRLKMIEMGWCRRTVNRQICRVRHIFRWAHTKKMLDKSVYQELEAVPGLECGQDDVVEKSEIEAVAESDIKLTIGELSPMIADMVKLQLRTGARPGELCILRPMDIDRSHDVWVYRPSRHKTQHRGRSRVICIGPEAQRILEPYLTRRPDEFCFSPKEAEQIRLAVLHSQATSPRKSRRPSRQRDYKSRYTPSTYRQAVHRACDRAKVPRWSPNQLRHTAATIAREQSGLDGAQAVLGHAHARTTEHYAKIQLDKAMSVVRVVG